MLCTITTICIFALNMFLSRIKRSSLCNILGIEIIYLNLRDIYKVPCCVCCNPCSCDSRYWLAHPKEPMLVSLASASVSLTWCLNDTPSLATNFMSASMLCNSLCIKAIIGSFRPRVVGIFQDLSSLTDFNRVVLMVKSDLIDTRRIKGSSCG